MTAGETRPFACGDRVKLAAPSNRVGRLVELRGPLGPKGAQVYRVQFRRKPYASFIEVLGEQLELVRAMRPSPHAARTAERKLAETLIVRKLADRLCRRISRSALCELRDATGAGPSDNGSEPRAAWEGICARLQHEEPGAWKAHGERIRSAVARRVERLPRHERTAIWLQTPEGSDWDRESGELRDRPPVSSRNITAYIVRSFVADQARRWTEPRPVHRQMSTTAAQAGE